jgi:iron complex transport system substrate-binding protein
MARLETAPPRRIVSFLPSATEMAFALGLGDQVLGVTHECDYPPAAKTKPVVVRPVLPIETLSQAEIDVAVTARLRAGQSLYQIDEARLRAMAPDLILTQRLCAVCAPADQELEAALKALEAAPEILWLTPRSMAEVFDNLRDLAKATGTLARAEAIIAEGELRLRRLAARTAQATRRPRVFCLEWIDPIYRSGHWVPEMVQIAGGFDELARLGADSVRIAWADVLTFAPEVLVVTPCGLDLDKTLMEARALAARPGWETLPAVQQGRVYAVDANAYFARPGPRLVDGAELLAHLIHPGLIGWAGPASAYRRLELDHVASGA